MNPHGAAATDVFLASAASWLRKRSFGALELLRCKVAPTFSVIRHCTALVNTTHVPRGKSYFESQVFFPS